LQHSFVEARAGVKYHLVLSTTPAENTIVQIDSCKVQLCGPRRGVRVGVFNFERSLRMFFERSIFLFFFVDAIVDWPTFVNFAPLSTHQRVRVEIVEISV